MERVYGEQPRTPGGQGNGVPNLFTDSPRGKLANRCNRKKRTRVKMALRVMNCAFWLGALGFILISVTSCNEVKLAVNTDIESPLRNTCQSGDLDPTFPKCQYERSPTFTGATRSMLSPSATSAE
jgi:hypothetical protein